MNITVFNNDNPFDSIRHHDEQGNEFWYARELMPLLEYKSWQKFNKVIESAIENLETVTEQVNHHIIPTDKMVKRPQGGGAKLLEYKLSRLACYHIALSCDSRGNNAVKMAKHYFAVKTREAEVIIPQQNEQLLLAQIELEKMKLENENLKLRANFMERRNAIQELHGVQMLALLDGNVKVIEKVEKVTETVICKNDRNVSFTGKSTAELGKELGFKTGKEFEHWLIRNKQEHLICQGMRAVQASYVPLENIPTVKTLFTQLRQRTYRQTVIGE